MVLYGYDASVYNSVQGSKHWVAYFGNPVSSHLFNAWKRAEKDRIPRKSVPSTRPTPLAPLLQDGSLVAPWLITLDEDGAWPLGVS
jgi:hypothetical protein